MNDPDLADIKRFQAGEHEAFQVLVERHAPRLFRTIARMTADRAAAEDLLQDALLQAYNALGRFRGDCRFYSWLYRIAFNKTLNWLRRGRGKLSFESLDAPQRTEEGEMKREVVDWSDNPEARTQQSEMAAVIERAVASLGEANRIVFTLREIEGLEFEEIARICECTQEAVRTRLHRAKKELKEKIRPYLENREAAIP